MCVHKQIPIIYVDPKVLATTFKQNMTQNTPKVIKKTK